MSKKSVSRAIVAQVGGVRQMILRGLEVFGNGHPAAILDSGDPQTPMEENGAVAGGGPGTKVMFTPIFRAVIIRQHPGPRH
jgi:hypothetical protein